jgi:hypothetical protein
MPIFGEAAGVISIARFKGAHSDRVRSASKKDGLAAPYPYPFPFPFPSSLIISSGMGAD